MKLLPVFVRHRLEGRPNLQKIIGNTGWLFIDRIVRMGVGLFVGVWVARYLGPEQFGLLSYAVAFVALFSGIATLGLDSIAVRNIVRDPSCRNETLGTVFLMKFVGAVITFGLTMGGIFILRPKDNLIHWLVAIIATGMIFQAFDAIDFWFQSQVQSKYTVYAKNPAFMIVSAAKIALIYHKASLIAFAWVGLVEIVIGSIALMAVYKSNGYYLKTWSVTLRMATSLLKDSWALMLSGIVGLIYLRIDQVILGEVMGNIEVGIYSVAVRLAEIWYFIPMVVLSSVLPSVVEAEAISESLFYERLQKLYNSMALVAYLVAVPITFVAGWLIEILFGPAYSRAGAMLAVLIWGGLFINLGVARSSFLTTKNWTRVSLMQNTLGALVNVVLNYVLIPKYGGIGAAIASCIAYWFAGHGSCFFYRPLFRTGFMLTKAMFYPRIW